ncbi:hypothetical protein C6I20_00440 [Aeromicrobium sp. A1-2]|nr:hypothetical protein C6I20_00440 [Aeromicrobium sp. A1-2]
MQAGEPLEPALQARRGIGDPDHVIDHDAASVVRRQFAPLRTDHGREARGATTLRRSLEARQTRVPPAEGRGRLGPVDPDDLVRSVHPLRQQQRTQQRVVDGATRERHVIQDHDRSGGHPPILARGCASSYARLTHEPC